MKRYRLLSVLSALVLIVIPLTTGHAQEHFAKLGSTLSCGHPLQRALKDFCDSLHGDLTLQIFPNGQLGTAQHILEGLQFGYIEMAVLPLESLSQEAALLDILGLPYLFKDATHRAQVLNGPLGKRFLDALETLNLVGLGFLDTYPRFYVTKQESLESQTSFQDRQVVLVCPLPEQECRQRVHDERPVQFFELMGAQSRAIPLEKVRETLESDPPDLIEYLPFTGMEAVFEGSEFNTLILTAHRRPPAVLLAGKRWFESLPSELKEKIFRASNTLVRQHVQLMQDALRHTHTTLRTQGMNIAEPPNEGIFEAVQMLYATHAHEFGPDFKQFWRAIQNIK